MLHTIKKEIEEEEEGVCWVPLFMKSKKKKKKKTKIPQ